MDRKVILGIGAHPDDLDFTAAGTIAKWVKEGAKAYYIIATDGSRGSDDPKMTHDRLIKIREEEQKTAAKILGLSGVFFLGHTDTELAINNTLKEQIVRYIREIKPDTVVTLSPDLFFKPGEFSDGYVNHTDHRAIAVTVMDCVFPLARDRLTFPEHEKQGLAPHKTKELLFMNLTNPEYVVDITDTFDKKLEALGAHKSQFKDYGASKERQTIRAEKFGKVIGVKYAENFTRIILP
jgi:LmbE family N-acetylglucosaminyl deacetylase